MSERIWSSASSTDLNDSANYSGSGALLTTDDLVFDSTSIVNATASANLDVNSITVASNYSGNMTFINRTAIYENGNASFDGTGTLHLGSGITLNGASAILHIGSGVGTVTASPCVVTMNGTTGMTIDDDKSVLFKSLVLGANAIVTNSGSITTTYTGTSTLLTFVNGGTLTINTQINLRATADCSVISITGSPTINGTSILEIHGRNSGVVSTLPAITMTGTTTLNIAGRVTTASTSHTITLSGNISAPTINIMNNTANGFVFDQGMYTITSSGVLSIGNSSTGSTVLNFNGNITSGSINGSTYNGATTVNLGASLISCNGNFTFGSNHTITPETSTVTITNTSNITSNGKLFYDLVIDASGKTITLINALSCHSITKTSGTITGNFSITFSGNASFSVSTTLYRLIRTSGVTGTITIEAGATLTLSNLTNTDLNGVAGALTQWKSSSSGTQFNLIIPDEIILIYQNPQDCNSSDIITVDDGTSVDGGNNVNWIFPDVTDDKILIIENLNQIINVNQYIDVSRNVIFKNFENENVNVQSVLLNSSGFICFYGIGYNEVDAKRVYLCAGKIHRIGGIHCFLSSDTDKGIGIHVIV